LLAQRKVTKRKGPPDDAPSGLRPPGARSGYGVFRQDIPVLSKNWPHPCGHPSGFPPPARRDIRGPRGQEPHQEPKARCAGPLFVGAHPVRERRPQGGLLGRGRAQGALLQGVTQVWGWRINLAGRLFVGAHPVRDKPTERYTPAWLSRTGCAPTDKPGARRDTSARCAAKAEAQRCPALSPQGFGRVARRLVVPAVYPRRLSPDGVPQAFGLIPTQCCGRYQAILFGLLFSWASKRKVTRAAAADRNARRAGGTLASTRQPETEALDHQPCGC